MALVPLPLAFAGLIVLVGLESAPPPLDAAPVPAKALAAPSVPKADRAAVERPASTPVPVASVEVIGVGAVSIILRDRSGSVLYRSDDATNTTVVARDADLPVVTVREAPDVPVVKRNVPPASDPAVRGRTPPGCETLVSPLAHSTAGLAARFCLAEARAGLPS